MKKKVLLIMSLLIVQNAHAAWYHTVWNQLVSYKNRVFCMVFDDRDSCANIQICEPELKEAPSNINFWNTLRESAKDGNVKAVQKALDQGADIEFTPVARRKGDWAGDTALILAVKNKHDGVIRLLIERGANINAPNNNSLTPLGAAAQANDTKRIALLLELGAEIDYAPYKGSTPLFRAASKGNFDAVKLLLEKGADPSKGEFAGKDIYQTLQYRVQNSKNPKRYQQIIDILK